MLRVLRSMLCASYNASYSYSNDVSYVAECRLRSYLLALYVNIWNVSQLFSRLRVDERRGDFFPLETACA